MKRTEPGPKINRRDRRCNRVLIRVKPWPVIIALLALDDERHCRVSNSQETFSGRRRKGDEFQNRRMKRENERKNLI